MIVSPSRFVFVHIPRTAGFSITQALATRVMEIGDLHLNTTPPGPGPLWCHSRACELCSTLPDWTRLYRFAVIRNPWNMIASRWRWVQQHIEKVGAQPSACGLWKELYAAQRMTFADWIPWAHTHLIGYRGFWHWFAEGPRGADLGVEPIQFHLLAQQWPEIWRRCGFDSEAPALPQLNAMPGNDVWTRGTIDQVQQLCAGDIERFGFVPPEPTA